MATGYDNAIPILRANKDANVAQGVTLKSIDSKLTTQTTTSTSEATADALIQGTQENLLSEILIQLKILNLHLGVASDNDFTEEDITE